MKTRSEKLEIELIYLTGESDPAAGVYVGGVADPAHLDELYVWVEKQSRFDENRGDFVEVDGSQVNVCGSREALFEFGRYLVALSRFYGEDSDYHDHFDEVASPAGKPRCEVIVHAPTRLLEQE